MARYVSRYNPIHVPDTRSCRRFCCNPPSILKAPMSADKPSIFIATPCMSGKVDMNYSVSLAETLINLYTNGIEYVVFQLSITGIDNARNILADFFLRSDCNYLVFIDDDISWAPDLIYRLMEEQVNFIGVPCRKKIEKHEFTCHHGPELLTKTDKPYMVRVDTIGMGMTLIHRNVFESLKNKAPFYRPDKFMEPIRMYFKHELVANPSGGLPIYVSEDIYFCLQANSERFNIWAYADETIIHMGNRPFLGKYSDTLETSTGKTFSSIRPRLIPREAQ